MFKLFGLNRKEKIKAQELATVYSKTLFEVIDAGFDEIIDFINDNSKFEQSPNIKADDKQWFFTIVIVANNHTLKDYFEEEMIQRLQSSSIAELADVIQKEETLLREVIYDYEAFFKAQLASGMSIEKIMAKSIFMHYNLNEFQGELLKNQNEPNPVFLQELTDLMSHFMWNWPNYMEKYRIV